MRFAWAEDSGHLVCLYDDSPCTRINRPQATQRRTMPQPAGLLCRLPHAMPPPAAAVGGEFNGSTRRWQLPTGKGRLFAGHCWQLQYHAGSSHDVASSAAPCVAYILACPLLARVSDSVLLFVPLMSVQMGADAKFQQKLPSVQSRCRGGQGMHRRAPTPAALCGSLRCERLTVNL